MNLFVLQWVQSRTGRGQTRLVLQLVAAYLIAAIHRQCSNIYTPTIKECIAYRYHRVLLEPTFWQSNLVVII